MTACGPVPVLGHRGACRGHDDRRDGRDVEGAAAVTPGAHDIDHRAGDPHRLRELQHGAREALDLVGRLSLGAQGHQEPADLARRGLPRHDLSHRLGGLVRGQCVVRRQPEQDVGPEVGIEVGLAHGWANLAGRPRAGSVARLACPAAGPAGTGGCGSMAERELPKLETGVRFPSPAPNDHPSALRNRGAVGHRSRSGHCLQRGVDALQISRPSRMNATCSGVRTPSGTRSCSSRSARSALAVGGIRPRRFATRCTCVSTGIASRPSAKLRTTAAVFGPTPGQRHEVVTSLVVAHPPQPRQLETPFSVADLSQDRLDPGRLRVGEAAAADGVGHGACSGHRRSAAIHPGSARRRSAKARSALRSLVCWESTVRISSSSGSTARGGVSGPKCFASRLKMARIRRLVGGVHPPVDARVGCAGLTRPGREPRSGTE